MSPRILSSQVVQVASRSFTYIDQEFEASIDGVPDQFPDYPWPRHILDIESSDDFKVRVRIEHEFKRNQVPSRSFKKLQEFAHSILPAPESWKPSYDYYRGPASRLGPILVVGAGTPTYENAVPSGTLILARPRVRSLSNGCVDGDVVTRLLDWLLSPGFRPKLFGGNEYTRFYNVLLI